MTHLEIKKLFNEVVNDPNFKKTSGLDKFKVYNYRKKETGLGTMLTVLYQMKKIKVSLVK